MTPLKSTLTGIVISATALVLPAQPLSAQAQRPDMESVADGLPDPLIPAAAIPFKTSSFTFARVEYSASSDALVQSSWMTDWPAADLHFSDVFERATGVPANEPVSVRLTDTNLRQYPFVYMVEGGQLEFTDTEAALLRDYLLGGGFLMVDDFWGDADWEALELQIRKAFPDRSTVVLGTGQELFRSFYEVNQTGVLPNIAKVAAGDMTGERGSTEAFYRGLFDDTGRLMAVFCHNTDFGDAWEHMFQPVYSRELLLEYALPMSLNIATYALSH